MLRVVDRSSGALVDERVYGAAGVDLIYGNRLVPFFFRPPLQRLVSRLYGAMQRTRFSGRKVNLFCSRFSIRRDQFEPGPFQTFDQFFTRKFKPGVRAFPTQAGSLGAFAEGRYFAFATSQEQTELPIKGAWIEIQGLLGSLSQKFGPAFQKGPILLCRLAPVDYHRFHFPDSGEVLATSTEAGPLESVNPVALAAKGDILFRNARQVSILKTKHVGLLAMIEVGALMVGSIEQTYREASFKRGAEKGMFHFGGSTVVVLGEPGRWTPSGDLLANTGKGLETLVQLGSVIGSVIGSGVGSADI